MIKISSTLINELSAKGQQSPRKRTMHNFHEQSSDPIQRMINAIEPYSYVQPHKHEDPDKREAFLIIRGSLLVVEFDESGNITDHVIINAASESYGVEIAPRVWHTIISLEEGTAVYELKDGPYVPMTDKNFACWAPKEGMPETLEYNEEILSQLNLFKKL